ncbi:MAG: NAD-dependent epimerase/dehydratase family protein [Bacteroidia bacterium]|nr:NAD-dependent epimerase/dehydratase family protein [Bacteroidia bacterium]MBT8269469.1 NAD-dependent epimerase/dehydratase family protein [Bacteroidia bacterium]NNF81704.1 DUF1611 domain-containing protein [Flavobacteriaceae bacterium]NNK70399.1 DUF1611 domain-containing protein [Flavobacteriaceae bacterium]NNL79860.1 DUF1611 domain-containing protein [Flavobacteriaceae bacterium]
MNFKYIFAGLTRISDLQSKEFEVKKLDKLHWKTGDYIIAMITVAGSDDFKIELTSGRMRGVMGGESIVGVLGERFATLEATGTWKAVEPDGRMHVLTGAGMLGKLTSKSVYVPEMIEVVYLGHVMRNGLKVTMDQFITKAPHRAFSTPVVLFVGTSMSAGKTTSARIVTDILKKADLKVVGAKLTGAGRYKDILAIKDVGADAIFDFVDVGLPSSICDRDLYIERLQILLNKISEVNADVAVIEIGASPLEPYNGDIAIDAIRDQVKCIILSASDPYSVYGLMRAFNIKPDIVTGVSTNTMAGVELVESLCRVRALNIIDPVTKPELKMILSDKLDLILDGQLQYSG